VLKETATLDGRDTASILSSSTQTGLEIRETSNGFGMASILSSSTQTIYSNNLESSFEKEIASILSSSTQTITKVLWGERSGY